MTINQKQKTLLPTLKERQRYMVYSIKVAGDTSIPTSIPKVNEYLIKECNALLGVFDAGKAGIMNVKYDEKARKGIIRLENKYVDKVKVCLGMMTLIGDKKVNIDVIYVSGMLNKADEFMRKN